MRYEVVVKVAPLLGAIAIARGGWRELGPIAISRDLPDVLGQQLSISLAINPAAVEHDSFDIRSQP